MEQTRVKKYVGMQAGLLLLALTVLPSVNLSSAFGVPDFNFMQIICKILGLVLAGMGVLYFHKEATAENKSLPIPFLATAGAGMVLVLLTLIPSLTPDWLDWLGCIILIVAFFLGKGAVKMEWNNAGTCGAYIILLATMLHLYNSVDDTIMTTLATIVGLVMYFIGLGTIKKTLDPAGVKAISKLKIVAILGIIGAIFDMIPLMGIIAIILSIIAFIFELLAYMGLKKSEAIGTEGKSGAGLLLIGIILALLSFIPVIGSACAVASIVLVFLGWNKIIIGMETQTSAK